MRDVLRSCFVKLVGLRSWIVGAMMLTGLAVTACTAAPPIAVDNFKNGETVSYPVPLLRGSLADRAATAVTITNESSKRDSRQLTGVAESGRFKALVELVPGENRLTLTAGDKKTSFLLTYKPQTNKYFIRSVLFVDETGDTKFETPIANDPQNYRGKYDAAMKIMQSFTADQLFHYGLGRRTFNIETDSDGKVIVHVVKGAKPADYYRYEIPNRNVLYERVSHEVAAALPAATSVDCVLIAFSKLDPKTGKSVAYTALGGGKIALFGGACMYAFPDSLQDVQKAFSDATPVDATKVVSDSVNRDTMWATASTSIGAMLHELGHSMGLPHSIDRRDIMTRGLDHFGRYFVFRDPPSAKSKDPVVYKPDQEAYWAPVSAAALAPSVWMRMQDRTASPDVAETNVDLSDRRDAYVVTNPRGIGFLGYEKQGAASEFIPINQAAMPKEVRVPIDLVRKAVPEKPAAIRVIDGDGNMTSTRLDEFEGTFVTAWRFVPKPIPAPDAKLPDLSQTDLASLSKSATESLTEFGRARIRIRSKFPAVPPQSLVYAARTIHCDADTPVHILTGSDVALRIWVNGTLVTAAKPKRNAKPDVDSSDATLKKGENSLLVEVLITHEASAYLLRLTDNHDAPLELADDGALKAVRPPELLAPK